MKIFKNKKTNKLWKLLEMDINDRLGYVLLAEYMTGELNEITMRSFLNDYIFVCIEPDYKDKSPGKPVEIKPMEPSWEKIPRSTIVLLYGCGVPYGELREWWDGCGMYRKNIKDKNEDKEE